MFGNSLPESQASEEYLGKPARFSLYRTIFIIWISR